MATDNSKKMVFRERKPVERIGMCKKGKTKARGHNAKTSPKIASRKKKLVSRDLLEVIAIPAKIIATMPA